MGLLNKIKTALFEEEEQEEEIAKKIDVAKTINQEEEIKIRHYDTVEEEKPVPKEAPAPIIFDVEDFVEEEPVYLEPIKSEQKILYGGYTEKEPQPVKEKEKFHLSPVISPVYGVLNENYVNDVKIDTSKTPKSLDTLFIEDRKKKLDLDEVRQKAYGNVSAPQKETTEEKSLLYEMESFDDKPGIEKISLGDAEEYFEDLGLEYDVDYKDLAKEKMTRTRKNQDLSMEIEILQEDKLIEKEVVKEEMLDDEVDEKNLYDLIDMMYDNNRE